MTLKTFIGRLANIAMRTPNVRSIIINDIYRANALIGIDYAAIGILQEEHVVRANTITYGITLVYIDRLLADASNEIDIQSDGMLAIENILNMLQNEVEEVTIEGDATYTSFNQRFTDDCAGVYATVSVTVDTVLGDCHVQDDEVEAYVTTEGEQYMATEGVYLLKK